MYDLTHVAIQVEAARYATLLAERKKLAGEPGRPPEIYEPHMIARIVERLDPERRTWAAARAIVLRGQFDDDRLSGLRLIEPLDRKTRYQSRRQMKQYVDHAFEPQPRERLGKLRPDAFQVGERSKERIEYLGSHR